MAASNDEKDDPIPCETCKHAPCLFSRFLQEFIQTDAWEAEKSLIEQTHGSSQQVARALRKRLYRNFAFWNGTMTKPPTKHPTCVEVGIRSLHPSKLYIGYKRKQDDVDNTAVDINNNKVSGAKWVRDEGGSYELEVDDKDNEVGDMRWQKRKCGSS